jgi:hypothetical protein
MENKTKKKKKQAKPPYRAVLEKLWKWAHVKTGMYAYAVVIVHVTRDYQGHIRLAPIKRYPLGYVTRQEAGEARKNLLDMWWMQTQPHPLGGDTRVWTDEV